MKLEPLMNYHANLTQSLAVGKGPSGNRLIVEVDGGEFEGPKLRGTIRKASCADWLLLDDDGNGHLDVRATFETHDGAYIYVQYFGRFVMTPAIQAALAGEGETDYGEGRFYTNPRMESGDERYKWVNNVVAVAEGRLKPGRVEYRVFQVVDD